MFRDRKYLDYMHGLPCCVTWQVTNVDNAVDPAHIGTAGTALKEHDFHTLPLIHSLHYEQSKGETRSWLKWFKSYPQALKEALQAWGVVYYLKYRTGTESNLELVAKITEMLDD